MKNKQKTPEPSTNALRALKASQSVEAHRAYIVSCQKQGNMPETLVELKHKVEQQRLNFQNMGTASLTIQDLAEAEMVGEFFSSLFPHPRRAKLGIMELLINAIEHGNLEISAAEKAKLIAENRWIEEISRRLTLQKYIRRRVHIHCLRERKMVEILIKDEGRGFDWKSHMNAAADKLTDLSGRGITCANFIGFDHLEYIASGYMVKGRQYTSSLM